MKGTKEGGEKRGKEGRKKGEEKKEKERERKKKPRVSQQDSNPRPSTLQPTAYGYRLEVESHIRTYYTCIYRKFRF